MNMNKWLEAALKKIDETPVDVLYYQLHGFSREDEENYKLSNFLMELEQVKEILITCHGTYETQYAHEDKIQPSKLFFNYISSNFESTEDTNSEWSNTIYSLPEYNFKLEYIYGQGTLTIFSLI